MPHLIDRSEESILGYILEVLSWHMGSSGQNSGSPETFLGKPI
jgi:hypothetical protein